MKLLELAKGWFETVEEEEYEEETVDEEEETVRERKPSRTSRKSKILHMGNGAQAIQILVLKPTNASDAREIADGIKDRTPVIFDVCGLQDVEARQVIDFVSGVTYGVDGSIQRISEKGIFIATPSNVDVLNPDGKDTDVNIGLL